MCSVQFVSSLDSHGSPVAPEHCILKHGDGVGPVEWLFEQRLRRERYNVLIVCYDSYKVKKITLYKERS